MLRGVLRGKLWATTPKVVRVIPLLPGRRTEGSGLILSTMAVLTDLAPFKEIAIV